jgi:hypothetical protein
MEVVMHLRVAAILKFIQPTVLSPLLKPMDQSKPGGIQVMEAKVQGSKGTIG